MDLNLPEGTDPAEAIQALDKLLAAFDDARPMFRLVDAVTREVKAELASEGHDSPASLLYGVTYVLAFRMHKEGVAPDVILEQLLSILGLIYSSSPIDEESRSALMHRAIDDVVNGREPQVVH